MSSQRLRVADIDAIAARLLGTRLTVEQAMAQLGYRVSHHTVFTVRDSSHFTVRKCPRCALWLSTGISFYEDACQACGWTWRDSNPSVISVCCSTPPVPEGRFCKAGVSTPDEA